MTIEETIQKKLHKLPTDKQRKVLELVESLAGEQVRRATPTLRQNWAGHLGNTAIPMRLSDLRNYRCMAAGLGRVDELPQHHPCTDWIIS